MAEATVTTCGSCTCTIKAGKGFEKDGKTYCCEACANGKCGCKEGSCGPSCCG